MNNKIAKILTIIVGVIGLIGFYFFFMVMKYGEDAIKADVDIQGKTVSPFVNFAFALLVVTAVIAIVASLVNMVKNPHVLKRTLVGVIIFGVLIAVSYVLADDGAVLDAVGKVLEEGAAGPTSKWVSTGINLSAILGVLGFIGFGADFIKSFLKN